MPETLVNKEKIEIVTLAASNKYAPRDFDSRIPSSPTHGDHRILSRQRSVEQNLSPLLKSKGERRWVGDDHECFKLDSVVSFREEFGIKLDSNHWKNFKQLLCGDQDLPFIILQNPTRKHVLEYEEMKQCPTLLWISDVLGEIGLTIEDVVIVDICSLFSDDDLDRMDKDSQRTWDAVEKSYAMVEDILELLDPSMVLSCQCVTRLGQRKRINGRLKTTWAPADNTLARALCSSQKDIRRGATKKIEVGSKSTLCVYGVHPRRLTFADAMIPELRGAFKDVFVPCMRWFRKEEKAAVAPGAMMTKSLPRVDLVIRTKAHSPSARKPIEVAVHEVEQESGKVGERVLGLKP